METNGLNEPAKSPAISPAIVSYRDIIRRTLADRIALNSLYSLRALARDLGLAASRLSEILNGKQGLSLRTAEAIAQKLRLSDEETRFFLNSVESLHSRTPERRQEAFLRMSQEQPPIRFQEISEDYFRAIADPMHVAFIYLTELANFESDDEWIAKKLATTVDIVADVKSRLIRVGLVSIDESGNIQAVDGYYSVLGGPPSKAVRQFHKSVGERAILALESQPVSARDFSASIVPASSQDIEKIRELTKEYRQNVIRILNSSTEKDSVYCLAVHYFKLTE